MSTKSKFFTKEEDKMIVKTIKNAELRTSGEIRIFVEPTCTLHVNDRTVEIFKHLKMHQTKERNGVLIYLSTDDKKFAIYGDEGIYEKFGYHFWVESSNIIKNHAIDDKIAIGLCKVIENLGEKLALFFPISTHVNELPDKIEYGE
jgi:uncharacterized membrane protein